jgi:large subunit ribosomal protein L20
MHGLKSAGIDIDRKQLADLAVTDTDAFNRLVGVAKGALSAA